MGDRLRVGIPSRYVTSQLGQPCIPPGSFNRVPVPAGMSHLPVGRYDRVIPYGM